MFRTDAERDRVWDRFIGMLAFEMDDHEVSGAVEDKFKEVLHERKYPKLTEEEIKLLFDLGASKEFVMVAQYDDAQRNTARDKADDVIEREAKTVFGDFAQSLWEGDLYHAVIHADPKNSSILDEVFGLEYINARARVDTETPTPQRGFKKNDDEKIVYR